ncbi:MAG: transcriptional activator RfaH [Magnetovibrio sp.]|nr:transcriptional activator RfaH [Magnetovibrio sp.]|tara:strand:- start:1016 stop:1519 length:504 start_codon:yes stop_codon:yes gene_type:complete
MSQWLVVYTHVHSEARAENHLRQQGRIVYLPRYAKTRRHARRVERVIRPFFPRYLFVAHDPERSPWRAIKSTVGVSGIMFDGERPLTARQEIIDTIQARENKDGLICLSDGSIFKPGQHVRIGDGPLAEQIAIIECLDDRRRAVVLMDLLGRQVKARIPVESLTTLS